MQQALESTISSSEIVHGPITKVIYPNLAELVKHSLKQQMATKTAELNCEENERLNSEVINRNHIEFEISDKSCNETCYASNQVEPNDETLASLLRAHRDEIISRAYLCLLERLPDDVGLLHYQSILEQRKPLLSIIGDIASSPESKTTARTFLANQYYDYIALKYHSSLFFSFPAKIVCTIRKSHLREIINTDNFIDNVYRYVLNRESDASGATHYANSLKFGKSKLDILLEIYSSEEAKNVRPSIVGISWFIALKKLREYTPIKFIIDCVKLPGRVYTLLINERINSDQLNELHINYLHQQEAVSILVSQMASHKEEIGRMLGSVSEQLKSELAQLASSSENHLLSLDRSAEQRFQSTLERQSAAAQALDSVAKQLKTELNQLATNSESKLIALDQSAVQLKGNLRELTNFVETEKLALDASVNLFKSKIDVLEQYTYATARRVAINLGNGEVLLKTGSGYLLCDQSDSALIACLIDTGELEYGTRIFIQSFLRESDVFIDVGANVGIHTLVGARAVGQTGKVYAIEAFGRTAALLNKSIYLNGLSAIAKVYNFAASNIKGKGVLHFGETSGHHSIYSLNIEGKGSDAVELNQLDDIIQSDKNISLLKIDVEGAELDVIKGAKKLFDANRNMALIIEYGPSHLRRVGINPIDWFAVIDSLNYAIFVINENTGSLDRFDMMDVDKIESVNLFCINAKSEYIERIRLPV